MAGDPFRVMTSGDSLSAGEGPFNAQWHNMVSEAIKVSQRSQPPGLTPQAIVKERDEDIWVANCTEEVIQQFHPIGVGQLGIFPATDGDFKERLVFLTDVLANESPWGIAQDQLGKGKLYVCIEDVGIGDPQPPSSSWLRLVLPAESYDPTTTYKPGKSVIFVDEIFVAKTTTTGIDPPSGAVWIKVGVHRGIWRRDETYGIGEVTVDPPIGRIILDGVSRAWINVSNTSHWFAKIGVGGLVSTANGNVQILWRQGELLGPQWAVVRLCCGAFSGSGPKSSSGESPPELKLAPMTLSGAGQYSYSNGGAPILGAMILSGTGTSSYVLTGSGAPTFGAMTMTGIGHSYDGPSTGKLFTGTMILGATGVQTTPPNGNGKLPLGAMMLIGKGGSVKPVVSGSGSLVLAAFVLGSNSGICCCTSGGGDGGTGIVTPTSFPPIVAFPIIISAPVYISGIWYYSWVVQVINPITGVFEDGTQSGDTIVGPWVIEINNTLVQTPTKVICYFLNTVNNVPLFAFAQCCPGDVVIGGPDGSIDLVLGEIVLDGIGSYSPGDHSGDGDLVLGGIVLDGDGIEAPPGDRDGTGDLTLGAMFLTSPDFSPGWYCVIPASVPDDCFGCGVDGTTSCWIISGGVSVTDDLGCTICSALAQDILLEYTPGVISGDCFWRWEIPGGEGCPDADHRYVVMMLVGSIPQIIFFCRADGTEGTNYAFDGVLADWACDDVNTFSVGGLTACAGWPATLDLQPCGGSGSISPKFCQEFADATELDDFIAAGGTVVSGPYADSMTCSAACSGGMSEPVVSGPLGGGGIIGGIP